MARNDREVYAVARKDREVYAVVRNDREVYAVARKDREVYAVARKDREVKKSFNRVDSNFVGQCFLFPLLSQCTFLCDILFRVVSQTKV